MLPTSNSALDWPIVPKLVLGTTAALVARTASSGCWLSLPSKTEDVDAVVVSLHVRSAVRARGGMGQSACTRHNPRQSIRPAVVQRRGFLPYLHFLAKYSLAFCCRAARLLTGGYSVFRVRCHGWLKLALSFPALGGRNARSHFPVNCQQWDWTVMVKWDDTANWDISRLGSHFQSSLGTTATLVR